MAWWLWYAAGFVSGMIFVLFDAWWLRKRQRQAEERMVAEMWRRLPVTSARGRGPDLP
jgi:hypothetical protein